MLKIRRVIQSVQQNYQRFVLTLVVCFAVAITASQSLQAQTTVTAGGFQVQFWSQGDNGGSGANTLGGTSVADVDLGTWSATEQAAVVRSFEYWSNRLNLPAAGAGAPVIRVLKDESATAFNANASSVLSTTGAVTTTNTYNRLINSATPTQEDGVDGRIVFSPGRTGGVVNPWGINRIQQIGTEAQPIEAVSVHEIGHLLGFTPNNTPFTDNITGTTATGANAVAVFGGTGVPLGGVGLAHTDIPFHNLTRSDPFGIGFRNILSFAPAELAVLRDMGYGGLVLGNEFGRTDYQDAVNATDNNATVFNSAADYGIGYFLQADNFNITQTVDLTASGFAGTGIRLSDAVDNIITIANGVTVATNGEQGIGFLAGSGGNNRIVHQGVLNANGVGGRGFVFDFGVNMLDPTVQINSVQYGTPIIDTLDISGTISASTNAIHIGSSAAVSEINVMAGASITGNIFSDALVGAFVAPVLTFGKTADANGFATAAADNAFNFTYAGNIFGTNSQAVLDLDTFGGTTTLNGTVDVQDVRVRTGSTLISNNTFDADNLTVNNTGSLQLNNGFTLDGGATQIDNGGLLTSLDYTMVTGTTNIDAGGLMTVTNLIDVQGGTFTLNGIANSVSNSFTIGNGAQLGGTGNAQSNLTLNGTIAPGNSIGTITVTGDFNSSQTGSFEIEAQPGGANPIPGTDVDLITVTGTAVVNGGTVNITAVPGVYQTDSIYRFLQAAGGLTVTELPFYTDDIAGFRALPFFDGNDLGFLIRPDISYSTIGQTYNQRSFGNYFGVVQTNPNPQIQTIRNALDLLSTNSEVLDAIDQLTGDIYASLPSIGIQNTSNVFRMLSRQQNNTNDLSFSTRSSDQKLSNNGWVIGSGLGSEVDFDGNAAGLDYSYGGTHFGVTNQLDDQLRTGFFGSYGQTSANSTTPYQSARVDELFVGGFVYHHDGFSFFQIAGGYGYNQYKTSRRVNFSTVSETANGDFTGQQGALFVEKGYEFRRGTLRFQPVGSLQYINYNQGRLSEKNGNATNLYVASLSADSFRSSLGFNLSNDLPFGSSWATATHLRGSWQHEYLDSPYRSFNTLTGENNLTFGVKGVDFGRDWVNLGSGVSIAKSDTFVLQLNYNTQINDRFVSHTGSGSLTMLW
ncbi:hypothetical protein MNBD_PLANCTO02-328 [hydrothermal vent metagenome]|uniref:Autotransporter domain-containing protein n=1 Tax=hydrothermal vent metagenome TaxID=652676 RepID=A0A3B1DJP0_9ZZZZ